MVSGRLAAWLTVVAVPPTLEIPSEKRASESPPSRLSALAEFEEDEADAALADYPPPNMLERKFILDS